MTYCSVLHPIFIAHSFYIQLLAKKQSFSSDLKWKVRLSSDLKSTAGNVKNFPIVDFKEKLSADCDYFFVVRYIKLENLSVRMLQYLTIFEYFRNKIKQTLF